MRSLKSSPPAGCRSSQGEKLSLLRSIVSLSVHTHIDTSLKAINSSNRAAPKPPRPARPTSPAWPTPAPLLLLLGNTTKTIKCGNSSAPTATAADTHTPTPCGGRGVRGRGTSHGPKLLFLFACAFAFGLAKNSEHTVRAIFRAIGNAGSAGEGQNHSNPRLPAALCGLWEAAGVGGTSLLAL